MLSSTLVFDVVYLATYLLIGELLVAEGIPPIEHDGDSPADNWEDRPEERVHVTDRPDDDKEPADHHIEQQMSQKSRRFLSRLTARSRICSLRSSVMPGTSLRLLTLERHDVAS